MSELIKKWENIISDVSEDEDSTINDEEKDTITRAKNDGHIQLIEPIKEKREFQTPAEFDEYYHEHKEELENKTTHKLNKMFNVPGYRITKIKGVLSLKNIPQSRITSTMKIETLELKVNEIRDRMNECINTVNKIVDALRGDSYASV